MDLESSIYSFLVFSEMTKCFDDLNGDEQNILTFAEEGAPNGYIELNLDFLISMCD